MLIGWIWTVVFWGLIIWAVFAIVGRLGWETVGKRTGPMPCRFWKSALLARGN